MKIPRKRSLIIGLDLDGCVANLHAAWLDWYNKTWNDDVPISKLRWDLKEIVKKECGGKIYSYLYKPDIYQSVKPIDGSIRVVKNLIKAGHQVLIITHPAGGAATVPDKRAWIEKYLPEIKDDDIIFTSRKELVKLDVFIDDSPKNIVRYRKAWPAAHILTISWPYNEEVSDLVNLRANSYKRQSNAWDQIEEYIEDI